MELTDYTHLVSLQVFMSSVHIVLIHVKCGLLDVVVSSTIAFRAKQKQKQNPKQNQNKQSKTKTQTKQNKTKQNMLNWSRPYIVMSSYCIWLFL